MRWPSSRATAKLLRRIRRKDMAIEKLKRRLTQLRRRIRKMKEGQDTREKRKAIIVTQTTATCGLDFVPRFERGEGLASRAPRVRRLHGPYGGR